MNTIQITPNWKWVSKYLQRDFQFDLLNFQLVFHIIWRSHFIFSHENHRVAWSFWIKNISKWNSNLFKTLFIYLNGRSHVIFSLGFCIWKEFEFMEIINTKMEVWESPFIPSHLTFKKFRISLNQSHNNQTINQSIYLL